MPLPHFWFRTCLALLAQQTDLHRPGFEPRCAQPCRRMYVTESWLPPLGMAGFEPGSAEIGLRRRQRQTGTEPEMRQRQFNPKCNKPR